MIQGDSDLLAIFFHDWKKSNNKKKVDWRVEPRSSSKLEAEPRTESFIQGKSAPASNFPYCLTAFGVKIKTSIQTEFRFFKSSSWEGRGRPLSFCIMVKFHFREGLASSEQILEAAVARRAKGRVGGDASEGP